MFEELKEGPRGVFRMDEGVEQRGREGQVEERDRRQRLAAG